MSDQGPLFLNRGTHLLARAGDAELARRAQATGDAGGQTRGDRRIVKVFLLVVAVLVVAAVVWAVGAEPPPS